MFIIENLSIPAFVFLCLMLMLGLSYGSYYLGKLLVKLYFCIRDRLRR